MEVLWLVIGAALMGGIWLIVRLVRRPRQEGNDDGDSRYTSGSRSSSSQATIDPEEIAKRDAQRTAYDEFRARYNEAETREDYTALLDDLERKRSTLDESDHATLHGWITDQIGTIDEEAAARAELEPKLAAFAALRTTTDKSAQFKALHKIIVTEDDDAVITYDELEEHGTEDDMEWAATTYDALLIERLREQLVAARTGTVADYQAVTALMDELEEYSNHEGEYLDEVIAKNLATEWNEMIVRFLRHPSYDDFKGLDDLEPETYPEIFRKATEGDLLSLALVRHFDEDQWSDFDEAILEVVKRDLMTQLDAQHLALGFKSGEEERSV